MPMNQPKPVTNDCNAFLAGKDLGQTAGRSLDPDRVVAMPTSRFLVSLAHSWQKAHGKQALCRFISISVLAVSLLLCSLSLTVRAEELPSTGDSEATQPVNPEQPGDPSTEPTPQPAEPGESTPPQPEAPGDTQPTPTGDPEGVVTPEEAGFVDVKVKVDFSGVDASLVPAKMTVTYVPDNILVNSIAVSLSEENGWAASAQIPANTQKLYFTQSPVEGVSFTLSGDSQSGYVLVATAGQTTAPSQDQLVDSDSHAIVSYNPPSGDVFKPSIQNKPGDKLLIKNPKIKAMDPRTDTNKNEGATGDNSEAAEELEKVKKKMQRNEDNKPIYIVGSILAGSLMVLLIVMRLTMGKA